MLFVWKLLARRSHVLIPGVCSLHVVHKRAIGPVFRFGSLQHISHNYYDGGYLLFMQLLSMLSKLVSCLETFSTEFTFLHSRILHVVTYHAVKTRFLFGSSQHRSHISLFLDLHRIQHHVVFLNVFRSMLLFWSFLHIIHKELSQCCQFQQCPHSCLQMTPQFPQLNMVASSMRLLLTEEGFEVEELHADAVKTVKTRGIQEVFEDKVNENIFQTYNVRGCYQT